MQKFVKSLRLNCALDFSKVFQARKHLRFNGFLLYQLPNNLSYPRLGMAVSKKHVNSAVSRNLIKRAIRETFRKSATLKNQDYVVVILSKIKYDNKQELNKNLQLAWKKCKQ